MSQLLHYLSMGKYTFYVWPSYGLVMMVLCAHWYSSKRQQRYVNKQLRHWFKHESAS